MAISATIVPRVAAAVLLCAMAYAPHDAAAAPWDGCHRAFFRVVIDVGHTKTAPGAMSARGVTEYDFNLNLARQIERHLIDKGFKQTVLMITTGRTQKGLAERVTRANQAKANLLLSVHHDSVPEQFMSKWEHEGKTLRYSDKFPGHSIFVSTDNPQYQRSLQFARLLGKEMKAQGLRYTPHYTLAAMKDRKRELIDSDVGVYQYNDLAVLMLTTMPAVLLEAGSIVHRRDEQVLASPERQKLVAAAVTDAVEQFCKLPHAIAPPDPMATNRIE